MQMVIAQKEMESTSVGADKWGHCCCEVLPVTRENFCSGYCQGSGAAVLLYVVISVALEPVHQPHLILLLLLLLENF